MSSDTIAAALRARIEQGRLPEADRNPDALAPGATLPSITALAREHGCSPETAHKALRRLAGAGLIHTRAGGHSIVADQRPIWVIRAEAYDRSRREDPEGLTTFEQQCRDVGLAAYTEHHHEGPTECPPDVPLGVGQVVHLWGEGHVQPPGADGQPDPRYGYVAGIYDTWVPAGVADGTVLLEPRVDRPADWVGGVYSVIERATGLELEVRDLAISGRLSTDAETARLGLARPLPVLVEEMTAAVVGVGGTVPLVVDRNVKLLGSVRWEFTVPIGR
jgi:DNA-binding GntR family transcriptional regulator